MIRSLLILLLACLPGCYRVVPDSYVRNRVVLLYTANAYCTGVEVVVPSGKTYTLTARHCKALLDSTDHILAKDEDGKDYRIKLIAVDPNSDLMLLQGIGVPGLKIADKIYSHEKVHTITHGGGMPSFRTDGELVKDIDMNINMGNILTDEDAVKCKSIKNTTISDKFMPPLCLIRLHLMLSTAVIIPGSSGGPLLDENQNIVGIVSAVGGSSMFGAYVTLSDIQKFIAQFK